MKHHDKILNDLVRAIEFCEAKPTNYSDESIKKWKLALLNARNYLKEVRPKNLTLEQIIDRATD